MRESEGEGEGEGCQRPLEGKAIKGSEDGIHPPPGQIRGTSPYFFFYFSAFQ